MESILNTIKKLLGILESYDPFDEQLIVLINGAIATLTQLGIGSKKGYEIHSEDETWEEYVGDSPLLTPVRTYIYLKVKCVFDPPQSAAVLQAYENQIKELEWRLNTTYETGEV